MPGINEAIDLLAASLARSAFRKSLDGYCRLVSVEGEDTLVADDGSLVSLFALEGFGSLPGEAELSEAALKLRLALAPYFAMPGHALQFWFAHSTDLGRFEIEHALATTRRVAHDIGLDIRDLIDERRRLLPERLTGERSYLAIWSRPALLSKNEFKQSAEKRRKSFQGAPSMRRAQWPDLALDTLRTRHRSISNSIQKELSNSDGTLPTGIEVTALSVRDALSAIKGVINPHFMSVKNDWKALLPGDRLQARMPSLRDEVKGTDLSNLLWPILSKQLMTETAHVIDQSTVEIGDMVFSAFDLVLPPEVIVSFNALIRRVLDAQEAISWRMSMLIESGGFQGQIFKEQYSKLFTWTAPLGNARIRDAFARLREGDGVDDTVVRFRVSFAVWCAKTNRDQLIRHVATLRRAVERWGSSQTDAMIGDPLEAVMSSSLALSCASTAPAAAASLADVLAMTPISRPARAWQQGSVLFRTSDGKLWPYQPGSSKQTSSLDLMVGTPGKGKSVLVNSINLGVALSPQAGRSALDQGLLPRISIIDIGPSSSGLISLIKDSLPVERRHEAVFHRLRMEERYAVNPFDTQLGLRFPLSAERDYLINLIALLCTPDGETAPYDGMNDLASACIDEVYKYYSDERSPKSYAKMESFEVDAALEEIGHEVDQSTTWWEVTDALFERDRVHEAALAQRYAVPTLSDLVLISNRETVKEPFTSMITRTQEPIVKAFQRMITAAQRDFSILAKPTRFDVSNARIIAFDLGGVTAKSGPRAARQTAIMYMLARHAATSDFWLDRDEFKDLELPEQYRTYHFRRIDNNQKMPKRLCFDEYHRTGGLGIRKQVVDDVLVGRKTGVQISLVSQLMDHFDDDIRELATNIFFCNIPTEQGIESVAKIYNLPPSAKNVLRTLQGPIEGEGAPFLLRSSLKSGIVTHYLFNQLGPIEIWALSTTPEDTALRSILYDRLGSKKARQVLAARYPSGSAKSTIDRRLAELEDSGHAIDDNRRNDVVSDLAEELIKGAMA